MTTSINPGTAPLQAASKLRTRFGLFVTAVGTAVFILGTKPEWFHLDRSPVIGFVQIAVFLTGLGMICLGGYVCLIALWGREQRSIAADIGLRMVSTGYVIAVFTGMADVFGMGTQSFPKVPFFGPWQAFGVQIGEMVIIIGFLLLIPLADGRWKTRKNTAGQ